MMNKTALTLALAAALGMGATACSRTDAPATGNAEQPAAPSTQDNPFFVQSDMPLQYPHFDRIRDEHFAPAFEAGMTEQLKEADQMLWVAKMNNIQSRAEEVVLSELVYSL